MCGIAGKFRFDGKKQVTAGEITAMTSALAHRGPDDEGVFCDGTVGLGHRRLSVIDLSPSGHQPMSDAEGRYWIVFNGEIYNFLQLRNRLEAQGAKFRSKTDTEVILHLYKEHGPKCLGYLRGMFSFAVWDKGKQELFVARDRIGKKPLKYYFDDNVFIFASELKAILKNHEVKTGVDYGAIGDFLRYQYVPHPKTGFKDIFKLEPAHYLKIKVGGKMEKRRYWGLDFKEKLSLSQKEWEDRTLQVLREAVRLRMISDVPLGAHLSGGLDSGLVVALMAQQSNRPIKTFSIGFKDKAYDELGYARLTAKRYATDHHEMMVEPDALKILPSLVSQYEEPFGDSSALPTWYLMQESKKHVTVALNGDGGDENFAGYDRYFAASLYRPLSALPEKRLLAGTIRQMNRLIRSRKLSQASRLLAAYRKTLPEFYFQLIGFFGCESREKLSANNELRGSGDSLDLSGTLGWLDALLDYDIRTYLPDDLLVKVDMASMAFSLEVRSPLLDQELLELTAKMPADLKLRNGQKKYLLKKIAEKYLPAQILNKPKTGFAAPLDAWFRNELKDFTCERLLDPAFLTKGFNQNYIQSLLNEHQQYTHNHSKKLWLLLALSEWFNAYFPNG